MKHKKLKGFAGILSLCVFGAVFFCPVNVRAEDGIKANGLAGKRVAVLVTEGFHDGETLFPIGYLQNRGAAITVIGIAPGPYRAYNSETTVFVQQGVSSVSPDDFDALIIPGGKSPDALRQDANVVSFVRDFFETGKPTAAICHGPQVLVTAGLVEGRVLTGYPDIRGEVTGAGGDFVDVEVHQDGNLVTSRVPDDLPAFCRSVEWLLID